MADSYNAIMADEPAHIILTVETEEPIDLKDFVSAFTSLSSQFEKFIGREYSDLSRETRMFVKEVRHGSAIVELVPLLVPLAPLVATMDNALIVEQFVRTYGARISRYFSSGGRDEAATKGDLNDLMGAVAAIANDPNGQTNIEAVAFDKTEKRTRAAIRFNTQQAVAAREQLEQHKAEMDATQRADHDRVLMCFTRPDIGDVSVGKRSGERVVVESLSPRALPLIYGASMAEERIKDEIRNSEDNVFKRGFVVDVNVEIRGGKPVGYAVKHVHQIIDLPDDDDG